MPVFLLPTTLQTKELQYDTDTVTEPTLLIVTLIMRGAFSISIVGDPVCASDDMYTFMSANILRRARDCLLAR